MLRVPSQEAHRLSCMPFVSDLFRQSPIRPKIVKWAEATRPIMPVRWLAW